jgi:hypothetical protein
MKPAWSDHSGIRVSAFLPLPDNGSGSQYNDRIELGFSRHVGTCRQGILTNLARAGWADSYFGRVPNSSKASSVRTTGHPRRKKDPSTKQRHSQRRSQSMLHISSTSRRLPPALYGELLRCLHGNLGRHPTLPPAGESSEVADPICKSSR